MSDETWFWFVRIFLFLTVITFLMALSGCGHVTHLHNPLTGIHIFDTVGVLGDEEGQITVEEVMAELERARRWHGVTAASTPENGLVLTFVEDLRECTKKNDAGECIEWYNRLGVFYWEANAIEVSTRLGKCRTLRILAHEWQHFVLYGALGLTTHDAPFSYQLEREAETECARREYRG